MTFRAPVKKAETTEAKTEEKYNYFKKYITNLLKNYSEINWEEKNNVNIDALKN